MTRRNTYNLVTQNSERAETHLRDKTNLQKFDSQYLDKTERYLRDTIEIWSPKTQKKERYLSYIYRVDIGKFITNICGKHLNLRLKQQTYINTSVTPDSR